jgi:hypothetical protein
VKHATKPATSIIICIITIKTVLSSIKEGGRFPDRDESKKHADIEFDAAEQIWTGI